MATCPECRISSRLDSLAITIEKLLIPAGPFGNGLAAIAGQQMKLSMREVHRMICHRCGWWINGRIEDDHFVAEEDEHHWRDGKLKRGVPRVEQ